MHKGLRINNLRIKALRFGSDLAEQNRRRSIAKFYTSKNPAIFWGPRRMLLLRTGQGWPKSEMHRSASYLFASPGFLSLLFILILVPGLISAQEIIRTSRYERPGVSTSSSDRTAALRERYSIPSRSSIISPSLGDDIILVVCRTDLKGADGHFIQTASQPVLFKDAASIAYYMLFNKEPVMIGEHAYSFDAYGSEYQIHYVRNGSVITKAISANEAFISQDSYMLRVLGPKKHE